MNAPGAAVRTSAETPMPRTPGALTTYLAQDSDFSGIGPAKAAALTATFGEDLGAAFSQKRPEVIAILGEETATNAFAVYELKSAEIELLDWLDSRGVASSVGARTAIRIARCWGHDGIDALKDNPYLLASFLPWATTDTVCRTLGIPPDDPRRAVARSRSDPLPPSRPKPHLDATRLGRGRVGKAPCRRGGSRRQPYRIMGSRPGGKCRRRHALWGRRTTDGARPRWRPSSPRNLQNWRCKLRHPT